MLTWLDNDFLHAENWVLGLDYDVWEFITFLPCRGQYWCVAHAVCESVLSLAIQKDGEWGKNISVSYAVV